MKRLIDYHLKQWKHDPDRKPLLLRGARQVGKTFAARKLGTTYEDFVDVEIKEIVFGKKIENKDMKLLKQLAKKLGIKNTKKMTKSELKDFA